MRSPAPSAGVVIVSGSGGGLVKSHEKRAAWPAPSLRSTTRRSCALRHVDFEVLIEPFVSAEQTVFNARCEDDGIFWINVFWGVTKSATMVNSRALRKP